ncbi:hypothetical protein L5876_12765 [Hyphobacterium sp. SN044]|uniref:hypothetical protein n=1 Tax=Hyphobacterium sp. SN044 TaxID=2912575 RepID=UPI001F489F16|nr:hypothetical protein [Hyphobacterium sp. SN044]MCF8880691.1 hypothetical protein [Hyphobacterium sp. SN044]
MLALSLVSALALVVSDDPGPSVLEDAIILDLRLRYELADQDGLAHTADALTIHARAGFETPRREGWSLLAEGEFIAGLAGTYSDTITARPGYPVIADPDAAELNRLQLSWQGEDGQSLTLGRQWINLDDQRFVGTVGFRQNSQSFDGVRLTLGGDGRVGFDYAWIGRVNRLFGSDHPLGHFESDSHLAELRATTGIGTLAVYGLWLDLDNAPGLSSRTIGARLAGQRDGWSWRAGYARQSDYANQPGGFALDYVRLELGRQIGPGQLIGGMEILGGDGTAGFQTPLATLHKFQGWADAFLTTPAEGLRDAYLRASYPVAGIEGLTLSGAVHDFASDDGDLDFGHELDLSAALPLGDGLTVEAKAAFFEGGSAGPADRTRIWLMLGYAF